jgi:maltoporin
MQKIVYTFFLFILASCTAEKKSASYYHKHEKEINEIKRLYAKLYETQPFTAGFSDKSFKYEGIDIRTDTVRYAMDNSESKEMFFKAVYAFNYDTVMLRLLYNKMKNIKSIWIGKQDIYYKGKKEYVTYLSFKSVLIGNPMLDNKYYMLVFFDPEFINPETTKAIEKLGYKKITNVIYFNIASHFRL